eukprot:tig00020965_g16883.t1
MAAERVASECEGEGPGAPEFSLLRRQVMGIANTVQSSFLLYAPVAAAAASLSSLDEDSGGGPLVHYSAIVKQRQHKLRVTDPNSPWIGRQLIIELADWETGKLYEGHACAARTTYPFVNAPRVTTPVDAFGETGSFALDSCRCYRDTTFELRIRDAATGQRPRVRIKVELVRPGASSKAEREAAAAERRAAQAAAPARAGSRPPSPPSTAPTRRHDEADEWPVPLPPPARTPPAPRPTPSRPQPAALLRPLPPAPPLPPALPLPSPAPPPPPLIISLNTRREDSVLEEAGYLDSLLSAFTRSAPAENRSSVSELLSSAEKKFWDLFVSSEAGELSFGTLKEEEGDEGEGGEESGRGTLLAAVASGLAPRGRGGRPPRPVPEADVEALFLQLSNLSVDPDAPAPVAVSPASPLGLEPEPPAPFAAPVPPPVRFSPPPYILDPSEEDEFMRRVTAAEAAGAGAALTVLLGDPRVLGTPLFRTPAGRIRTRHLLVLVRVSARSAGPGRPRALFPPPSFDAILQSLIFNLHAGPSSYPTLEEAERACENVWNFVTVATSDFVLVSPDFLLVSFDEVLALHERAMELAANAVASFGPEPRAELLATAAKVIRGRLSTASGSSLIPR